MDNKNNPVTPQTPVNMPPETTLPTGNGVSNPVVAQTPQAALPQAPTPALPSEPVSVAAPASPPPVSPQILSTLNEPSLSVTTPYEPTLDSVPPVTDNTATTTSQDTSVVESKPTPPTEFSVSNSMPQSPAIEPLTQTSVSPLSTDQSAGIQESSTMPSVDASAEPNVDKSMDTSQSQQESQSGPTSNLSMPPPADSGKKRGLSGKTALLGFIIGLVVLSIPVSVILVQQQQNLLQEAKTKKNVPVRTSPEVIVATPTPYVPLTTDSAQSELDKAAKDIDEAVTSVDQDLIQINQTDSNQDNESL